MAKRRRKRGPPPFGKKRTDVERPTTKWKPTKRETIAPDHHWPRNVAGSVSISVENDENGEPQVTVTPNSMPDAAAVSLSGRDHGGEEGDHDHQKKIVYDPEAQIGGRSIGSDDPRERVPLADISLMQDLLLVRNRKPVLREQNLERGSDDFLIRQQPRRMRMTGMELTPERLVKYLEALEEFGLQQEACRKSGIAIQAIRDFRKESSEFQSLVDDAMDRFREKIEAEAYRRGVIGWDEPIIGGRNKDRVVATKRMFDSRLLEIMLKRHRPEFRERVEADVKVTGGVLLVPAPAASQADWARQHGGERLDARDARDQMPPGQERVLVDGEARVVEVEGPRPAETGGST